MATKKGTKKSEMTLGALVAHPLRSQCLTLLADRTASPAEISIELGENLGNVSYHVRKLWKGGAVEIVEEKPVRGAMEHFYRAVTRPLFTDEQIAAASLEDRAVFAKQALALLAANATSSLEDQTFVARPDFHVTRVPARVDESGWREMRDLFEQTLERVFEIQNASADRLRDTDDAGIPIVAFNTFFEMPERKKAE
ncbi:MAG: winged helix-turn-helix transcriptional regulator [Thermoleophilia bacterium]|nr:winged helix-turn-helix transcriptional regulator [Thermoleophilia bacterium]